MAKQIIVSHDGFLKLQNELEYLKTVKRKEVAQAIQKAREYGDLSENSEYDEAKNEQAEIESKIAALEVTLANAVVIDDADIGTDKVGVGNTVELHCIDNDEEYTYKISDDCPLGKTLLGQKKGDSISVETPGGIRRFTITNISK